jgi:hypothetical protein
MNIGFSFGKQIGLRIGMAVVATSIFMGVAQAQNKEPARVRPAGAETDVTKMVSPGDVAATPEMWFYEQSLRRYNDPKVAVRANSEFKADQRRARMAAMNWYGYSNSRPAMGIDNLHGPIQTQWVGNSGNASWWVAPRPAVVLETPRPMRGY